MSAPHFVDEQGRYDGRTLQELWPSVVDEVVRAVDPAGGDPVRLGGSERHDDVGSILYWPAREGSAVYRRASVHAVCPHEWLRFANDDLAAAPPLLTDAELPARMACFHAPRPNRMVEGARRGSP